MKDPAQIIDLHCRNALPLPQVLYGGAADPIVVDQRIRGDPLFLQCPPKRSILDHTVHLAFLLSMINGSFILDYSRNYDYNGIEVIQMDTQPKNCTGPTIRRYRQAAGLSYAALSRGLREKGFVISPRRLKHIEEQTAGVYVNDLVAFARFFNVKISALFEE